MFLIEYEKGCFIDGDAVDWIKIDDEDIKVTLRGDVESIYKIADGYQASFLNHLQVINKNMNSVESFYHKQKEGKQND